MKIENIKFRGKSKKTVEWLYGDLIRNVEGAFAIVPPYEISMNNYYRNYVVDKETIGQFTGLYDERGVWVQPSCHDIDIISRAHTRLYRWIRKGKKFKEQNYDRQFENQL